MLKAELPYFDDPEGNTIPNGCGNVIDTHIHVFPENIFKSIWHWFDENAWKIRYRLTTHEIFKFLLDRGLSHIVALQYAHKPGIAKLLNGYLAQEINAFPGQVSGMATVFPGEQDAVNILKTAFKQGLTGVKLHAHVQCFDMNASYMDPIYQICSDLNKPMVMHVGTEPRSDQYKCDPYDICNAEKLKTVISNYPNLNVCVPHLGFGEIKEYRTLIESHDNLWTDTTMVICDYFPLEGPLDLSAYRMDRIMYGSDFPNIPYEWDRELKVLAHSELSETFLDYILYKNAMSFFNIDASS